MDGVLVYDEELLERESHGAQSRFQYSSVSSLSCCDYTAHDDVCVMGGRVIGSLIKEGRGVLLGGNRIPPG